VTGESITLSWSPPTSDGGNTIQYYILEKREKKTIRFYKVITKKPIIECAHKVLNLTEDAEYEFRVKCKNMGGESDWSEISAPIIPKSEQSPRAPAFREEIRDMTVKYHANATFVTKVPN